MFKHLEHLLGDPPAFALEDYSEEAFELNAVLSDCQELDRLDRMQYALESYLTKAGELTPREAQLAQCIISAVADDPEVGLEGVQVHLSSDHAMQLAGMAARTLKYIWRKIVEVVTKVWAIIKRLYRKLAARLRELLSNVRDLKMRNTKVPEPTPTTRSVTLPGLLLDQNGAVPTMAALAAQRITLNDALHMVDSSVKRMTNLTRHTDTLALYEAVKGVSQDIEHIKTNSSWRNLRAQSSAIDDSGATYVDLPGHISIRYTKYRPGVAAGDLVGFVGIVTYPVPASVTLAGGAIPHGAERGRVLDNIMATGETLNRTIAALERFGEELDRMAGKFNKLADEADRTPAELVAKYRAEYESMQHGTAGHGFSDEYMRSAWGQCQSGRMLVRVSRTYLQFYTQLLKHVEAYNQDCGKFMRGCIEALEAQAKHTA